MLPHIVNSLPTIFKQNAGLAWSTEFGKGYRQIDVLAAAMLEESDAWQKWTSMARVFRKLKHKEMETLAILVHAKRVTPAQLAKKTWLPLTEIRQYLSYFVRLGLAEELSRRSYGPTDWAKNIPICLASIEAKLKDWPSALKQATYNRPAVDYSYVAVPLIEFRERKFVLTEFRKRGIGVIGITNEGQSEILVKARRKQVCFIDNLTMTFRVVSELPSSSKWMHVQPTTARNAEAGTF